MKDKIVVAPHQIDDYDLDIQSVGHNGAEEYIRKDAFLEWLEKTLLNIRNVVMKENSYGRTCAGSTRLLTY